MAIDLQKLEQKFNALLDDPNFVTDFEQWLEARNVSQNSGNPFVSGQSEQLPQICNCVVHIYCDCWYDNKCSECGLPLR